MAPRLDVGWDHATPVGGDKKVLSCNYCGKIIHGGITRMNQHIARIKGNVETCVLAPQEVSKTLRTHLNKKIKEKTIAKTKKEAIMNASLTGNFLGKEGDIGGMVLSEMERMERMQLEKAVKESLYMAYLEEGHNPQFIPNACPWAMTASSSGHKCVTSPNCSSFNCCAKEGTSIQVNLVNFPMHTSKKVSTQNGFLAYFKDHFFSGEHYLVILDDEHQPIEKGTSLVVYESLIGDYARSLPKLTNSLHKDEWTQEVTATKWVLQPAHHIQTKDLNPLPTLGRNIINGKAEWGDSIEFAGEFHFIEGYWEWTEDILSRCKHTLEHAGIYNVVYASLFTYDRNSEVMKAFCEAWCPTTNTLLTSFGEMSISLWDLHSLAGLPITGYLFDETVPNVTELIGTNETKGLYLPRCCRYLFHAYHSLRKDADGRQTATVSIDRWIRFWSKKVIRYTQPPERLEKKKWARPKQTYNPSGKLDGFRTWTFSEVAIFNKFKIKNERLREETYLAAFLACWICTFVLPNDDVNLIRPQTFKVASMMALGKMIGLAVPVLTSIYKGLNKISNLTRPSQVQSIFPSHFVYVWLAHYFKTHFSVSQGVREPIMVAYSGEGCSKFFDSEEARKRIHKGDIASLTCNMLTKDKDISFVDEDDHLQRVQWHYFMAIRSGYLPLRHDNHFFIEPYSPHRFARQFGYYQEVPGTLKRDIREASLEEGVYYWQLCVLSKSMAKAQLPHVPTSSKKYYSVEYKKWWNKVHGDYFEENTTSLINKKPSEISSKDKICVDEDVPLNQIRSNSSTEVVHSSKHHHESQSLELVGEKRKNNSCYCAESSSHDIFRKRSKKTSNLQPAKDNSCGQEYATKLKKDIFGEDEEPQGSQDTVVGPNSLAEVPISIEPMTKKIICKSAPHPVTVSIFKGKKFIFNHRKKYLQELWIGIHEKVAKTPIEFISSMKDEIFIVLDEMKSLSDFDISSIEASLNALFAKAATYDKIRSESSEKVTKELLAQQLDEAKNRLYGAKARHTKEVNQLQSAKIELEHVQMKFSKLEEKMTNISASIEYRQQVVEEVETKIHNIEEEISAIKNTSPLDDDVVVALESSKSDLKIAHEELKNLNPFA